MSDYLNLERLAQWKAQAATGSPEQAMLTVILEQFQDVAAEPSALNLNEGFSAFLYPH